MGHVSTEPGARDVNLLKEATDNDRGKNLILCTSVMPTSLKLARNWPMCSYVVLVSSPLNLEKSSTLKPHGYGTVSKYSG
jgi:hypothetical protein